MAKMTEKQRRDRQELEKRFDKFLDDANIIYRSRYNSSGTHLFVAHSSYREDDPVVEFCLGTADSDGFDSKIRIPVNIESDLDQVYGSIEELVALPEPQFNYWMTRALDYDSQTNHYAWQAKNDYAIEAFNMFNICPDILTETERIRSIIEATRIDKCTYEERVDLGVQLTQSFLENDNKFVPEAYAALMEGLEKLDIDEKVEEFRGLTEASNESAEYLITKIKKMPIEELQNEDLTPEKTALEAWKYAYERNITRQREWEKELLNISQEPVVEEKVDPVADFTKTYEALKNVQKKAEEFLRNKEYVNDKTGFKMYPVCIAMTEHTPDEIKRTNAAFTCTLVLGSNTQPNTPEISMLANDKGEQLFDVSNRTNADFEKWLKGAMEKAHIMAHSEQISKALENDRKELYDQSFEMLEQSDLKHWSYHDKVAFGVQLTQDFVELNKFEDEKEIEKFHKAIEKLDLNITRNITKGDLIAATNEGGEYLISQVMQKSQDELRSMNSKRFSEFANTWANADKVIERGIDKD